MVIVLFRDIMTALMLFSLTLYAFISAAWLAIVALLLAIVSCAFLNCLLIRDVSVTGLLFAITGLLFFAHHDVVVFLLSVLGATGRTVAMASIVVVSFLASSDSDSSDSVVSLFIIIFVKQFSVS